MGLQCVALGRATLRRREAEQALPHHEQIRQRAGDHEPVRVLGEAAVAHLGEAEDAFDHAAATTVLGINVHGSIRSPECESAGQLRTCRRNDQDVPLRLVIGHNLLLEDLPARSADSFWFPSLRAQRLFSLTSSYGALKR